MKLIKKISSIVVIAYLFCTSVAVSQSRYALAEEDIYRETIESLQNLKPLKIYNNYNCEASDEDCMSAVDIQIHALDELSQSEDEAVKKHIATSAKELASTEVSTGQELQLFFINNIASGNEDSEWARALRIKLYAQEMAYSLSRRTVYILLGHTELFLDSNWAELIDWVKSRHPKKLQIIEKNKKSAVAIPTQVVKDLVLVEPDLSKYKSGRYNKKPRVFMFCRANRNYPCLVIMKNSNGKIQTLADGVTPWSQASLGLSRHKKEYNQTNGNTPSGVLRIDGVMPEADQQLVFGKFRRLILNFVAKTDDEADTKLLLPKSSHQQLWWQESSVARDVGRGMFRVHGTGLLSRSGASYYPLVPTSGCVAQRENTYRGVTYRDQREFLDELMKASNLEPIFENEEKIKALFYVININDTKKAVELIDLKDIGIW